VEKRDNATEWENKTNACYEYQCYNDTGGKSRKRENAIIWEDKSHGCCEYQCHNDREPIYWKKCDSTEKIQRLYDNDECIDDEGEIKLYVEIEVEGLDLRNLNMTEIQSVISDVTNIGANKLSIHAEINEKDEVVYIIVIEDDETTANTIKDKINNAINEGNPKVQPFKSATVKDVQVSSGTKNKSLLILTIMTILMTFFFVLDH